MRRGAIALLLAARAYGQQASPCVSYPCGGDTNCTGCVGAGRAWSLATFSCLPLGDPALQLDPDNVVTSVGGCPGAAASRGGGGGGGVRLEVDRGENWADRLTSLHFVRPAGDWLCCAAALPARNAASSQRWRPHRLLRPSHPTHAQRRAAAMRRPRLV